MARIELKNITPTYGDALGNAVADVNITWEDGSANALLGPSGCGKTTSPLRRKLRKWTVCQ